MTPKPGGGQLLEQFVTFTDVLTAAAYGNPHRKPLKAIAVDMDVSSADLSRWLSGAEGRRFPADRLADFVEASGDKRPIYWLIDKFLPETDVAKRVQVTAQLRAMLADVNQLIE